MRQLGGVAWASVLYLFICLPSEASDAGYQDWQFTNSANPAVPTVATNAAGTASATIVVGYGAIGWLASLSAFGTQTGLWDLGGQNPNDPTHVTRGQVQLTIPNPGAVSGNSYTDLGLNFVQFIDGSLYVGDLLFSLPDSVYLGRTIVEIVPGMFGGSWVEDHFRWHLAPSPAQVSLTITGAVNGTLLDRIRVDTLTTVVPAPPLFITSIAKLSDALAISWTGGVPPYQLYVTSNLLDNASWQPVGQPVPGAYAEIPLIAPAEFVRVRGSN